jgi:SH3-like domain-containing protein
VVAAVLLVPALTCATSLAAYTSVRVTSSTAELRSAPGSDGVVVSKSERGETLQVLSERGGWVEVRAPGTVSLWVHGELLKGGVVEADKASVRAGPGTEYATVVSLSRGANVKVVGALGEWQRIRAPDDCHLWVAAGDVMQAPVAGAVKTVSGEKKGVARPRPPPKAPSAARTQSVQPEPEKPVPVAVVPVVTVKPSPPPVTETADESRPQPPLVATTEVVYEGIVRPAPYVWRRPSMYRLLRTDERGRTLFECYVQGNNDRLASLIGQTVTVRGRGYSIQGVRNQVVWIDDISVKQ